MEVQASLSPPPSSPLYQGARPPPIASPDTVLLYDPVEQLYYEVPAHDIRPGKVEVMDIELIYIEDEDEGAEENVEMEDEDDDVVIVGHYTPRRRSRSRAKKFIIF